ncbi:MAG: hypothetical protein AAGB00_12440 [Planctomycetota bacterium]
MDRSAGNRCPRGLALTLFFGITTLVPAWVASAEWIDCRQVGPFNIQSTFDLKPHQATLDELPALEAELRRVLAIRPAEQPIAVLLFRDKADHAAYLALRFPGVPHRRALFVRQAGQATVFAYRHAELAIDLRHECTHALLHADLPMLPLWLDEGLAEYFEMPAGERAFGNPHAASLRLNMRLGFVRSLESLEAKQELADLSRRDYQYAWAWTHFLLHGPRPATEQLWAYLGAVRRGEPPGLMSARVATAVPNAKSELVQHFRQWEKLRSAQQGRRGKLR